MSGWTRLSLVCVVISLSFGAAAGGHLAWWALALDAGCVANAALTATWPHD